MAVVEKSFSVHPNVIKSIILEQAGDTCKALAELVMNSVDAKATCVDIELSSTHFVVRDDGFGFKSKQEVLDYFGTFGTPHDDSDETTYGVFRIGRGQCFAKAKTYWRSGYLGMSVDLDGLQERTDVGYELHEFKDEFKGCEIRGEFYDSLHTESGCLNALHFNEQLKETIGNFSKYADQGSNTIQNLLSVSLPKGMNSRFFARLFELLLMVDIPVRVNGVQITKRLNMDYLFSTPSADFYCFSKRSVGTGIFYLNQGIHITTMAFPVPCVVNFKKKPRLNMARNSISKDCEIYKESYQKLLEYCFQAVIQKNPKFKDYYHSITDDLLRTEYSTVEKMIRLAQLPNSLKHDDFIEFLKLIPVHIISAHISKINLVEFLDFLDGSEFEREIYLADFDTVKEKGSGAILAEMERWDEAVDIVFSIGNRDVDSSVFFNIDMINSHNGYATNYEYFFGHLEEIDLELETLKKSTNIQLIKGKVVCGKAKEISNSLIGKNSELISLLEQIVYGAREYLQARLKNLSIGEPHPLTDNEPIQVRFLNDFLVDMLSTGVSDYSCYVYLDGQHFMLFNHRALVKALKGLPSGYSTLKESIASSVYLSMMNADFDKNKPMHVLHDLRMKNEAMLFDSEGILGLLNRLDEKLVGYSLQRFPPKKFTRTHLKATQKKIGVYQEFFADMGGISPTIDSVLKEIIAVES